MTKNKKSKNKLIKPENTINQDLKEDLQIECGLKSKVQLRYIKDKNGSKQIDIKGIDKVRNVEEIKKILDDFYSAFGVKNIGVVNVLIGNVISVLNQGGELHRDSNLDFAYNFLKEINPKDQLETMLAIQMLGTHLLSCKTIYRANLENQTFEGVTENINRATKLTRTYIAQMEALKKYRSKGNQKITVEHININEGGKAVIGTVNNQINNNLINSGEGKDEK